ncbi:MAG TPA: hypothetical protein VF666_17540 [Pyrinomonadaceae bacterium]|jgi:hypothetical protein
MTETIERLAEALLAYPLLVVEAGVAAAVLACAFVVALVGRRWLVGANRWWSCVARKRAAAVLFVALFALAARAAILPILPIPEPFVHDEFSYLLSADTFAQGRLANPTHPFWMHFETFHVLQQPTYASKYPPAQGLLMAAGQLAGGHAWFGVWLSVGLMCGALCWMLQGWLPPRWALVGGIIAALRLGVFTYWINGYYGGALAATGGALVLGALPRIMKRRRVRDALLLGLGLVVLANSRPFEGVLVSVPVGAALMVWMWRQNRATFSVTLKRVVLPVVAVLALAASAMTFYYWRVTGNPFRMPYQIYQQTYDPVPLFIWQKVGAEPQFRHASMRHFIMWQREYVEGRSVGSVLKGAVGKASAMWLFFAGPALTLLVLVAACTSWRDRRMRVPLAVVALLFAGLLLETYFSLHYAAPAVAAIYVLLMQAWRRLTVWRWRGRAVGRELSWAIPVICLIMFGVRVGAKPLQLNLDPNSWRAADYYADSFGAKRAPIVRQLEATEGRHLVLVRYGAEHRSGEEWVYNRADIDGAKIVWAREMDESRNRELIGYFRGRRVWLLEADAVGAPRLSPYSSEAVGELMSVGSRHEFSSGREP